MHTYITRLCWNEHGWERPSGSARRVESGTFATKFGFGFEEWLFSSNFEIRGQRYGFVQGANKSQRRLAGHEIRLILFTIAPDRRRLLVGQIAECHVLTREEADAAHTIFDQNGAIDQMIRDVASVGGDTEFIRDKSYVNKWTLDIINVRYSPRALTLLDKPVPVPATNQVWGYSRYQLVRTDVPSLEALVGDPD